MTVNKFFTARLYIKCKPAKVFLSPVLCFLFRISFFYTSSNVYKYLSVCLSGGQGQGHVHDDDDDDDADYEEEVEDVAKLLTHFWLGAARQHVCPVG